MASSVIDSRDVGILHVQWEDFSRIDDPQWEDLNVPTKRSHGRIIESKL
jgi:hypothetical protein